MTSGVLAASRKLEPVPPVDSEKSTPRHTCIWAALWLLPGPPPPHKLPAHMGNTLHQGERVVPSGSCATMFGVARPQVDARMALPTRGR